MSSVNAGGSDTARSGAPRVPGTKQPRPRPHGLTASGSWARRYPRGMSIKDALAELQERLVKARTELRIAEEQLLFQMDAMEDAKTRALVAETPLADREYQEARGDYERMLKIRDEAQAEVDGLQREQDKLLDRML